MNGQDLPDSVRKGQRLTGMSGNQATLPLAGSIFKFAKHGKSGASVSELLPHTAKMADELCFVKSLLHRGDQPRSGDHVLPDRLATRRPAEHGRVAVATASAAPTRICRRSSCSISKDRTDQALYARLWGNGFLPSIHQGVQFRSGKDPVLYLEEPRRRIARVRRKMLDRLAEMHALQSDQDGRSGDRRPRCAI